MKEGGRMADRMHHRDFLIVLKINAALKNSWRQFAMKLSFLSHTLSCTYTETHGHVHARTNGLPCASPPNWV